ncbi:superoxide dismutase [Pseudomonas aeruginosa]|uniref:superoxide dismutase n=1 Tax=Pseudomonas aeruginosa TaxID=287 RepID=UPI003457415C
MPHALPPLPYAYDALEPHIDALTMEIHHSKHHQTYVNNLNAALEGTPYAEQPVESLLRQLAGLPEKLRTPVVNNGGGHANHSLFWTVMSPQGGGRPDGDLGRAIDEQLECFEAFKDAFTKAALTRFGSGWAWLSVTPQGSLLVESSGNQDSPLMNGNTPILGLDVWEHAYYLKYQNRRPEYIGAFYNVIDWREVARRYAQALA